MSLLVLVKAELPHRRGNAVHLRPASAWLARTARSGIQWAGAAC
jgi:hypothetical protein